jgi:uncharacterized protein (DUF2384 family)
VSVLTSEERLRSLDQTVGEVKQRLVDAPFVEAAQMLCESEEVDSAFEERLREIAQRLRALPGELEPSVFDREQLHTLHTALHETRDLLQELKQQPGRLDTLNELLVTVERIRHVIRDAIDEHVTGITSDAGGVLRQLHEWLPNTPQREIARLVDVDRRTLTRWSEQPGPPKRRLQLVAQLVAILRHSWTEDGVLAWFDRPNRGLDDRKPISLLDDAAHERDLLMAARSTRSQYGT